MTKEIRRINSLDELGKVSKGEWIKINGREEKVLSNDRIVTRSISAHAVTTTRRNGNYVEKVIYSISHSTSMEPMSYEGFSPLKAKNYKKIQNFLTN